jgi:propanol-preferring alcohol dehydrogenase
LICPGISSYAAFKLTEVQKGDKLGIYGFGPTCLCTLKIANLLCIDAWVSTRSPKNIENAKKEGAVRAYDASKEPTSTKLNSAIIFPPAGNLVEPALAELKKGGNLVLAPVSMSPIAIKNYSENLWGYNIKTLYNLNISNGKEFFNIVDKIDLKIGTSLFSFDQLPEALISAEQGKLDHPNAVIKIAD